MVRDADEGVAGHIGLCLFIQVGHGELRARPAKYEGAAMGDALSFGDADDQALLPCRRSILPSCIGRTRSP
jgi:hypothetical protein